MMKARCLAAAAAALLAGACASAPASPQWRSLFDGRTLDGWTPKIVGHPAGENAMETFRVRDGALAVSYEGYDRFANRFGHIFYKTPFQAYRLRLDYRFVSAPMADTQAWAISNSGVMIFAQAPSTMAIDQGFPVSAEAQLLGPAPGQSRTNSNMCSPGTNVVIDGALVTQHCVSSKTPVLENGVWRRFEIEVTMDGVVTQFIDGQPTITYSQVQLDPRAELANSLPLIAEAGGKLALDGGYIALQSEGHPIEFRNIEILEYR
jgi:hypothetical protein